MPRATPVRSVMTTDVVSFRPDEPIRDATLRLLDRYKPCRLEQERAEVLPPPAVRHRGRHALVRQEDMEGGPERSQGEGVQRLPEGGREARVACRHHRSGTDDTRPRH